MTVYCPNCGSSNLDPRSDPIDNGNGQMSQLEKCNMCNHHWEDKWQSPQIPQPTDAKPDSGATGAKNAQVDAGDTVAEVLEWVEMPLPLDVEYDLKTIEGEGGEVSWAREHIREQNRIIHELYSGNHGSIPHPAETWQAGLWEVYKPDEYQCHAERVGAVGELATLRAELASAKAEAARLRAALEVAFDHLDRIPAASLMSQHDVDNAYNALGDALQARTEGG